MNPFQLRIINHLNINMKYKFFVIIVTVLLLNSCQEKKAKNESISYKRLGTFNYIHQYDVDGIWNLEKIIVFDSFGKHEREIKKKVVIKGNKIMEENSIIANSPNGLKGVYDFKNLDSLNGYFFVNQFNESENLMIMNSGLTIKIKNGARDNQTSSIKLIFSK